MQAACATGAATPLTRIASSRQKGLLAWPGPGWLLSGLLSGLAPLFPPTGGPSFTPKFWCEARPHPVSILVVDSQCFPTKLAIPTATPNPKNFSSNKLPIMSDEKEIGKLLPSTCTFTHALLPCTKPWPLRVELALPLPRLCGGLRLPRQSVSLLGACCAATHDSAKGRTRPITITFYVQYRY